MFSVRPLFRARQRPFFSLLFHFSYTSSAAAIQAERTIREGSRNDWTREEVKSVYDSPVLDLLFHGVSFTFDFRAGFSPYKALLGSWNWKHCKVIILLVSLSWGWFVSIALQTEANLKIFHLIREKWYVEESFWNTTNWRQTLTVLNFCPDAYPSWLLTGIDHRLLAFYWSYYSYALSGSSSQTCS